MTGWEYVTLHAPELGKMEPRLNELGAEGWELVGVVAVAAGGYGDTQYIEAVLKRPCALGSRKRS